MRDKPIDAFSRFRSLDDGQAEPAAVNREASVGGSGRSPHFVQRNRCRRGVPFRIPRARPALWGCAMGITSFAVSLVRLPIVEKVSVTRSSQSPHPDASTSRFAAIPMARFFHVSHEPDHRTWRVPIRALRGSPRSRLVCLTSRRLGGRGDQRVSRE